MDTALLSLLSSLWLHEPDAAMLARAQSATAVLSTSLQTSATPTELAVAYADLFLLNVYPYGTAYTDAWGELNTPDARRVRAIFESHGYQPRELSESGAPDHLGLCLGFLSATHGGSGLGPFVSNLLAWAPVCCLSAEREPAAHPFYRALARLTREALLGGKVLGAGGRGPGAAGEEHGEASKGREQLRGATGEPAVNEIDTPELRLRDVVRVLLFPARCGFFLSRGRLGRLANLLQMRLPFGSRFEVAEWLFASAGEGGQVVPLLQALIGEADQWRSAYRSWTVQWPAWQPFAALWLARIDETTRLLNDMQQQAEHGVEVSYELPVDSDAATAVG